MWFISIIVRILQIFSKRLAAYVSLIVFPKTARPFIYYLLIHESGDFTSRGSNIGNPANISYSSGNSEQIGKDCGFAPGEPCMGVYFSYFTGISDLKQWIEAKPEIFNFISSANSNSPADLRTFASLLRSRGYFTASLYTYSNGLIRAARDHTYSSASFVLACGLVLVITFLIYICCRFAFNFFKNILK